MTLPEARLLELGLTLPPAPEPIASYVAFKRVGDLLYLSGQGPSDADGRDSIGRLGDDCTVARGYTDARQVGLKILALARQALGSLDGIESVVKLLGMVHATPDFTEHPKVVNGCSDLLIEVLGERGRHARSAVGVASLPGGITVEVEAILQIAQGY